MIAQKERRVNELKEGESCILSPGPPRPHSDKNTGQRADTPELAQQEASLSQLKSRWTSLMTRQSSAFDLTSPPTATSHVRIRPSHHHHTNLSHHSSAHPLSSSHRRQTASISVSSSTSSDLTSLGSDEIDADATVSSFDQSIANLLSSIPGEGIGMEEALEGGKKFWGNVVKTVSAAAAGTVPAAGDYERRQSAEDIEIGGFDL
jgi:hypothetical protein